MLSETETLARLLTLNSRWLSNRWLDHSGLYEWNRRHKLRPICGLRGMSRLMLDSSTGKRKDPMVRLDLLKSWGGITGLAKVRLGRSGKIQDIGRSLSRASLLVLLMRLLNLGLVLSLKGRMGKQSLVRIASLMLGRRGMRGTISGLRRLRRGTRFGWVQGRTGFWGMCTARLSGLKTGKKTVYIVSAIRSTFRHVKNTWSGCDHR